MKREDNVMKKVKLIITICLSVILIVLLYFVLFLDDAEKRVYSCRSVYSQYAKYSYVEKNDEEKLITIAFDEWNGSSEKQFSAIKPIYEAMVEAFFDKTDDYNDYTLEIILVKHGSNFVIGNIKKNSDRVTIMSNFATELDYVAEAFPNASSVSLYIPVFDSISEVDKFNDLEYLFLGNELTVEEREYIISKLPNCELK